MTGCRARRRHDEARPGSPPCVVIALVPRQPRPAPPTLECLRGVGSARARRRRNTRSTVSSGGRGSRLAWLRSPRRRRPCGRSRSKPPRMPWPPAMLPAPRRTSPAARPKVARGCRAHPRGCAAPKSPTRSHVRPRSTTPLFFKPIHKTVSVSWCRASHAPSSSGLSKNRAGRSGEPPIRPGISGPDWLPGMHRVCRQAPTSPPRRGQKVDADHALADESRPRITANGRAVHEHDDGR